MKKILLGFAFIATLALMLTSCPGPKAKDSVSGKFDDLVCGKEYKKESAKELTIKLATDKFANQMNANTTATELGISIQFKDDAAGADAEPVSYGDKFKLKENKNVNATEVVLYFVSDPYQSPLSGQLSIEIAADKLTEKSKKSGENVEGLKLGPISFKVSVGASFDINYESIILPLVEGVVYSGNSLSVALTVSGATLVKDADGTDPIDVTSWFNNTLPLGVTAKRNRINTDNKTDYEITFNVPATDTSKPDVSSTTASSAVSLASITIPKDRLSTGASVKSSNSLSFFVTKNPNAPDASKKPKLTISKGTLTGKVGEAITEAEFTLTLDGDCVIMDVAEEEVLAGMSAILPQYVAVGVGDAEPRTLAELEYNSFIKVEIPEPIKKGATSFKVKFSAPASNDGLVKINKAATDAYLYAYLPGRAADGVEAVSLLCNNYGTDNLLKSTKSADAKFVITDDRSISMGNIALTFASAKTPVDVEVTLTNDTVTDALTVKSSVRGWFDEASKACIDEATVKSIDEAKNKFTITITPVASKPAALGEANKVDATFTIPAANLTKGISLSVVKEITFVSGS